jgi:hypothetical protein
VNIFVTMNVTILNRQSKLTFFKFWYMKLILFSISTSCQINITYSTCTKL